MAFPYRCGAGKPKAAAAGPGGFHLFSTCRFCFRVALSATLTQEAAPGLRPWL